MSRWIAVGGKFAWWYTRKDWRSSDTYPSSNCLWLWMPLVCSAQSQRTHLLHPITECSAQTQRYYSSSVLVETFGDSHLVPRGREKHERLWKGIRTEWIKHSMCPLQLIMNVHLTTIGKELTIAGGMPCHGVDCVNVTMKTADNRRSFHIHN